MLINKDTLDVADKAFSRAIVYNCPQPFRRQNRGYLFASVAVMRCRWRCEQGVYQLMQISITNVRLGTHDEHMCVWV